MKTFPIYDNLVSLVRETPRKINWLSILSTISDLPISHKNLIYLIIYHYSQLYENNKKKYPYGGKSFFVGNGITFDFEDIPWQLKEMIYIYVTMITI